MWRNHVYAFYLDSITNGNGNTKFSLAWTIPETKKDISVHFLIHSSKVTEQYSFYFRLEKLQFSQLLCKENENTQFRINDTLDSRAIDFIEEVNIDDTAGIEVKSA